MKLSVSIPDDLWILVKARHPDLGPSEIVRKSLLESIGRNMPSDDELVMLGRRIIERMNP